MTEPTEEMKAMARRVAAVALANRGAHSSANEIRHGRDDNHAAYQAALAAIIETQRLIVEYLESVAVKRSDQMKITAIRSGKQYGKE